MKTLRQIDELTVDVLIDNLSDSYSSKPASVSDEFSNVAAAGAKQMAGATLCCAQLGLSLMLTATAAGHTHKLLFDAGPEGPIFLRNCRNLGVTLADVRTVAISHGHWDHMGALVHALDEITRDGRTVPCHVNPGMFIDRGARLRNGTIAAFEPVPSPATLGAHGAEVISSPEERFLADGYFYLSGEIPRITSFERGRPDHLCRTGPQQPWQPDPLLMDERYLAVNVRGKGIIVFSACSHAGIINVLSDLREKFAAPIHGVFGGLHLVGEAMEKNIPETIEHLKDFDLKLLIPAHCSGWRALHALLNTFGESIISPCAVGNRYRL